MPLLDSPELRDYIKKRTDCTCRALVNDSKAGKMGRAIYNYSDFMYCKYLGKVPNNYMITLRKFPIPCSDHINNTYNDEENKHFPDMGRLVTWIGTPGNEMENILKYSYSMPWDEQTAPLEDDTPERVGGSPGGGMLNDMINRMNGYYKEQLDATNGYGSSSMRYSPIAEKISGLMGVEIDTSGLMDKTQYEINLSNKNRIVSSRQNTIMKVTVPGGKEGGLEFTHDINLTFDYELRSYDGVNGRSAMLDLLANILIVTYLQGKFFPGLYRPAGTSQSQLFTNLEIFKQGRYRTPADFMTGVYDSIKQITSSINIKGDNILETLKNFGSNIFEGLAQGLINKMGRPELFALSSLISPNPTGQWHLTVGNPKNPILSIGNLILTNASIEHYGPLGLDDFPTGLRVTVTLKHAKPRDSVAIEQMYMQGDYRIYTPMGEHVHRMYENVKEYKSSSRSIDKDNSSADKMSDKSDKNNDIFVKYFGTSDAYAISIAAEEALTGASPIKDNKTQVTSNRATSY